MTKQYSHDRELIKDFIRYISDEHKCAVVSFADEFAASAYVNYKFVNVGNLIDEFIQEKGK